MKGQGKVIAPMEEINDLENLTVTFKSTAQMVAETGMSYNIFSVLHLNLYSENENMELQTY